MLKPVIAGLAAIAVGAGGVAWAHDASQQAERHNARHACVESATEANPDAGPDALGPLVAECMGEAGFTRPEPTPEQIDQREAAQACMGAAREEHADGAEPATVREGLRACMEEAGFQNPGRALHRMHNARSHRCMREVRANNDGPVSTRQAVRECLGRPAGER